MPRSQTIIQKNPYVYQSKITRWMVRYDSGGDHAYWKLSFLRLAFVLQGNLEKQVGIVETVVSAHQGISVWNFLRSTELAVPDMEASCRAYLSIAVCILYAHNTRWRGILCRWNMAYCIFLNLVWLIACPRVPLIIPVFSASEWILSVISSFHIHLLLDV